MEESAQIAALSARVESLERAVAQLLSGAQTTALQAATPWVAPPPPLAPSQVAPPPVVVLEPSFVAQEPSVPVLPVSRVDVGTAAALDPRSSSASLENRLGAQVFNLVGILALVIATAYGLKLAIENGWLGPVARVMLGLGAGVAVVLGSERLRRKGMAAYSYSLKAVGSAVLYLSLWAGFQLYHLSVLPAGVALGAMILVTAWNAFMAWSQDSEVLAAYALAGGFLTPLLLSTGGDHEAFLFLYLGVIDLALVVLLRFKPWRVLVLPSFAVTVLFFIGWYVKFFADGPVWTGQSSETAAFAVMFASLFAVVPLVRLEKDDVIVPVLLPLSYAAFEGLALYSVLQDSGLHVDLPWLMVGLAAVYLGLMQLQRNAVARAMHLAVGVVFLTVAIPFKASGHTLTTAWLVEGLVLYWASTKFEGEDGQAAKVLWGLAGAGYCLGLTSLVAHWFVGFGLGMGGFWNRNLGAAAVAIATVSGAIWLDLKSRKQGKLGEGVVVAGLMVIDGVAVLLCLREVVGAFTDGLQHEAFANVEFATAAVGLCVLAGVAYWAWRLRSMAPGLLQLAGATLIGFNLLTILSIVHEIRAFWQTGGGDLQRSLTVSGFLMVYGAALLAVGFWKRSSYVRWQALVLLVFTVCKVFLSDIGRLSAGYRVASFMGLGAMLMGVSYAYQKDWLGLKETPVTPVREREG